MSHDPKPVVRELKAKQKDFVEYYLVSLNATEAAIKAGYPEKSARSKGSQLLTNVNISAEIARRRKEKADKIEIDQNRVLEEAAALMIANIGDVITFSETGVDLKNPTDIPVHAHKAIKKITFVNETRSNDKGEVTTFRLSVEMHDKIKLIEFWKVFLDIKSEDKNGAGNSADARAKSERVLAAVRQVAAGRKA